MLLKSIAIFLLIVAVHSATLQGRNIPVEVRYERLDHDITSNLAAKVQLSSDDLKENQLRLEKLNIAEAEELVSAEKDHSNLNKNLAEKIQLSPDELLQSTKHIPIPQSIQDNSESNDLVKLGEALPASAVTEAPSKSFLIQQAQDVIETGLKNLRKNFMPKGDQIAPPKALWDKLENDVKEYFLEEKNKVGLRQDQGTNQQNIFQNFANGFQQMTNNFIQQFQGQNQNNQPPASGSSGSGDEGAAAPAPAQGPFQGFVGYFTGGVQNIVSSIQNIGQSGQQASGNNTVLGDNGSNQAPSNFIGNIVNGVQQFFQGPQQGINQVLSGNNTQGDTGSGSPSGTQQQGFFAGAISQINQVVSNIIPTSQAPPTAAVQGDEGTGAAPVAPQGGNPIQSVFQQFGNIGTAFNQFIQGGPQNKPQGSEDEATSQAPNQNFIQSIGQNIGNAFQNIQNQFRPPGAGGATAAPAVEGADSGSSNPIIGQVSNIGNQLQQVAGQAAGSNPIQNLIPGSSSDEAVKKPADEISETIPEKPEIQEIKTDELEKKEVMTATE